MAIELLLPSAVAGNAGRLRTLECDEERVPMGIVVESALNVELLLERLARGCLSDSIHEVANPHFDGAVHLIVTVVRILEGDR